VKYLCRPIVRLNIHYTRVEDYTFSTTIPRKNNLKIEFNLTIKIVPRLAAATRSATYCLQMHLIGDLPVIECKYEG
jgi:hypothetical protein